MVTKQHIFCVTLYLQINNSAPKKIKQKSWNLRLSVELKQNRISDGVF